MRGIQLVVSLFLSGVVLNTLATYLLGNARKVLKQVRVEVVVHEATAQTSELPAYRIQTPTKRKERARQKTLPNRRLQHGGRSEVSGAGAWASISQ